MNDKNEKKTASEIVAAFIQRFRFIFLGLLAAAVLGVAGSAVYLAIESSANQKAAKMLDAANDAYEAYFSEEDAAKKNDLEAKAVEKIDALAKAYPRRIAGLKGQMLKARIAFDKENFGAAQEEYAKIAEAAGKSYLAAIALQDASVMAERAGNLDLAISYLQTAIDKHADTLAGISHAYFNVGRLQEQKLAYDKASETYSKMESLYPGDSWTNLAKSRIIVLKSQGLIP
jgi:tetratricopeptide (TPR) repeat protein